MERPAHRRSCAWLAVCLLAANCLAGCLPDLLPSYPTGWLPGCLPSCCCHLSLLYSVSLLHSRCTVLKPTDNDAVGDHAYVEWVRVVVDEQTLLATSEGAGTGMEAWRPLMEGCTSSDWEWTVHSEAWADEWKHNKQFPFLKMADNLAAARSKIDNTPLFAEPHLSPWPSWHARETVPVTDFSGLSAPWNTPTSGQVLCFSS